MPHQNPTSQPMEHRRQRKSLFKSIGPAIIVAAVVLGPGSILTSSKVGASFGLLGFPVVIVAAVLMIAMVALSARLGAVYEKSLCDELSSRVGRPFTVFVGLTLFTLVALFQSSNNIALIGGIEPLFGSEPFSFELRAATLAIANLLIIASLYLVRDLYRSVEGFMKLLMGLMTAAFLVNFAVVMIKPQSFTPVPPTGSLDWIPLLGMIGTTFSVGGAFYQAYLVKEKGWGLEDVRSGVVDSIFSITLLGIVTSIVLLTSWRVFYGNPQPVTLASVGDVARQLEPSFGATAKVIFCSGILAGALSSFLVNALIGGTVMSDSLGKGARLQDKWPVHLTVVALVIGMLVAVAALRNEASVVPMITLAQACTVLGLPALAGTLIYLGTRPELTGPRKVPTAIIVMAIVGFFVSCVLMYMLAQKVYAKLQPAPTTATIHDGPSGVPLQFALRQTTAILIVNVHKPQSVVCSKQTSNCLPYSQFV
ncbi:MAG: divalent metal cation transporter [Fuerstiella sp.]